MRLRRTTRGLPLPWEQRSELLRGVLSRPRLGLLAALLVAGAGVHLVWGSAEARIERRTTYVAISDTYRAVHAFRSEIGRCPRSAGELTDPPRSVPRYLRETPRDGWGRPLHIHCLSDPDEPLRIVSAGPSGSLTTDDNLY